ncbi:MAG: hypothetical protein FK734_18535 [Asgard group archaeon]|nr:hypothetical protein [Asgard group archaeon]
MNRKTKIMLAILILSINISFLAAGIVELDGRLVDDRSLTFYNNSSSDSDFNNEIFCNSKHIDFYFHSGLTLNNPSLRDSLVPYPNNHSTPGE